MSSEQLANANLTWSSTARIMTQWSCQPLISFNLVQNITFIFQLWNSLIKVSLWNNSFYINECSKVSPSNKDLLSFKSTTSTSYPLILMKAKQKYNVNILLSHWHPIIVQVLPFKQWIQITWKNNYSFFWDLQGFIGSSVKT